MKNVHVFVPVKHESQRVPGKNFRLILGEPLWHRCIRRFSEDFSIFIDTDSSDIIQAVGEDKNLQSWKIYVRERQGHLCGNDMSVNRLIDHFIHSELMVLQDHIVVQIHVTSPFLSPDTVRRAVEHIKSGKYDSVVGCNIIQSRLWREEGLLGLVPVNHNPDQLHPTQHLPRFFEENSSLYAFRVSAFDVRRNRIGLNPLFMPVSFPENVDIDTEEDWNKVVKLASLEWKK